MTNATNICRMHPHDMSDVIAWCQEGAGKPYSHLSSHAVELVYASTAHTHHLQALHSLYSIVERYTTLER